MDRKDTKIYFNYSFSIQFAFKIFISESPQKILFIKVMF